MTEQTRRAATRLASTAVAVAFLTSTSTAGEIRGGILLEATIEVESGLLLAGYDAGGYSEGTLPTVLVVDCKASPELANCSKWGAYDPKRREILLSDQTPERCRRGTLLFQLTRDALAQRFRGDMGVAKPPFREWVTQVAARVSGMRLGDDGRFLCEIPQHRRTRLAAK